MSSPTLNQYQNQHLFQAPDARSNSGAAAPVAPANRFQAFPQPPKPPAGPKKPTSKTGSPLASPSVYQRTLSILQERNAAMPRPQSVYPALPDFGYPGFQPSFYGGQPALPAQDSLYNYW
jgi:hypothetical protein